MKFEFNWPSGFRGEENVEGRTDVRRTTDAGAIDILIAHLGAFGSGELKIETDHKIQIFLRRKSPLQMK